MERYPLSQSYLYAVTSPGDLARRLRSTPQKLEQLASGQNTYRHFTLETGREVQEPRRELQRVHSRIHSLLARVEVPDYLHSTKGRSYVTNAKANQVVGPSIKLDLKRFFPSVQRGSIFRFFASDMRCAGDVAGLLAKLLTVNRHLATGSSASPTIAYYTFKRLLDELEALAVSEGLVMTCYVDDITMTGRNAGKRVLDAAHQLVRLHGLRSHRERHLKRNSPKIITGVAVTQTTLALPHVRQQKIRMAVASLPDLPPEDQPLALKKLASRLTEAAHLNPQAYAGKALEVRRQIAASAEGR